MVFQRLIGRSKAIDFTLQEPVFYKRLLVGITANPTNIPVAVFADNVRVSIRN
ncbi:MAG: hypothetical protein ACJAZ9_000727 [Neolewinella sp.]|jgi:hypothetical protein